jgi:glycosyltransferase involved in cell wall biosynthesis
VTYVPWCTEIPDLEHYDRPRDWKTGIHVGGLNRFKNAQELAPAVRTLLDETDTEHFTVVGPGPYAAAIQALARTYSNRVTYIESLPRHEALTLMAKAGYALLTAKEGALGFMGDCFGLKLPLLSLYNPGGLLKPGEDALVTEGRAGLAAAARRMLEDEALRVRITSTAHARYITENTAAAVGQQYEAVFERVLAGNTGSLARRTPAARKETAHAR